VPEAHYSARRRWHIGGVVQEETVGGVSGDNLLKRTTRRREEIEARRK
jgi:hypothetical protein